MRTLDDLVDRALAHVVRGVLGLVGLWPGACAIPPAAKSAYFLNFEVRRVLFRRCGKSAFGACDLLSAQSTSRALQVR